MLLANKLKQLDTMITKLESSATHDDLYTRITHDLQHIQANLQDNIAKMQKHFDSTIIANQKEFQEITTEWTHENIKRIEVEINKKISQDSQNFLNELSKNITNQIQKQVEAQMQNIHEQIDLQTIINAIKDDQKLIDTITQESIKATIILMDTDQIEQECIDRISQYINAKIDLNAILKAALETQEFQDTLKLELQEKIQQVVQETINAQAAQEQLQESISKLTQEFISYIQTSKQEITTQGGRSYEELQNFLQTLKLDAQTHTNTLKDELTQEKARIQEEFKQAFQEVITIFEDYLQENKFEAMQEIIATIVERISQDESMQQITEAIIHKSFLYVKEFSDLLQEAIIERSKQYFIDNISDESIKQAILQDTTMQEIMREQSYKATKDRIDNAVLRDFITDLLKKKAQEILKNDELLRAEAEAQAHLVAMRLQSGLSSMQEILDNLIIEFDITAKLELLAQKEKEFALALQEAKDELKDEFKGTIVSDTIQKYIDSTFEKYDKDQDAQTDSKIDNLKTLLEAKLQDLSQENLNQSNTIISLETQNQALETQIQALEALTNQLQARIDMLENNANNPNPPAPNIPTPPQTQGNNKYLVFS